jgi:hypothetical protein
MPIRGLRSHPVEGVKAAKKRLPKLPRAPLADDLQEQSLIYLKERNKAMRLKRSWPFRFPLGHQPQFSSWRSSARSSSSLAERLRSNGVDAQLDQYVASNDTTVRLRELLRAKEIHRFEGQVRCSSFAMNKNSYRAIHVLRSFKADCRFELNRRPKSFSGQILQEMVGRDRAHDPLNKDSACSHYITLSGYCT